MARGFNYAPGASPELNVVRDAAVSRDDLALHVRSKNPLVREVVAARVDCPFGLLVSLAHDVDPGDRSAVAANTASVAAILEHLATDASEDVLLALVDNPVLTHDAVERLAMHKTPAVRAAAVAHMDARARADAPGAGGRGATDPRLRGNVVPLSEFRSPGALGTVAGVRLVAQGADVPAATGAVTPWR